MKNIELTENHKSKLLEMCNKLFPEYPNLEVRDSMEDFCMEQDNCFIELQESGSNSRKDTIIHWFEFCMTEVVEKILNPTPLNPNRGLQDKFKNFFWKVNEYWMHNKFNINGENSSTKPLHPVDYLYEEFKKLK